MLQLVLGLAIIAGGLIGARYIPYSLGKRATRWAAIVIGGFLVLSLNFVTPGGRQIVLLDKVFLGGDLQEGRLIATSGERGLQAETLPPGFQFFFGVKVLYNTSTVDYITIPPGSYGLVSARDGQPLEDGAVIAPPVPVELFLDAEGFMEGRTVNGTEFVGTRGRQTTILRPGSYPINTHLFDVEVTEVTVATEIPTGSVAVIKSAVNEGFRPDFMTTGASDPVDCSDVATRTVGTVSVELVPVGCRGTWEEALPPGTYFLNRDAYEITMIESRTNVWTYRGGYDSSTIDLTVGDDGSVTQTRNPITVGADEDAVGDSVAVKVEGWTVYVDVRVQAQASPAEAPAVVAAVGDLDNVRERFITPALRSALRNIGGGQVQVQNTLEYDAAVSRLEGLRARLELLRSPGAGNEDLTDAQVTDEIDRLSAQITAAEGDLPEPNQTITRQTLVLDFIENREVLEGLVQRAMEEAGEDAGVTIVGVRFGNVDIPAELLVARKREQLAQQFRLATVQERLAQAERIATERERATADQQQTLVTAQIAVQTSELGIAQRDNQGEAERRYLEALAAGEQARVDVIGQDRVFQLRLAEALIAAVQEQPEILTGLQLPATLTVSNGNGGGLVEAMSALSGTQLFGGPANQAEGQ